MTQTSCPQEPLVRRFLLGGVAAETAAAVNEHLTQCATCQELVRNKEADRTDVITCSESDNDDQTEQLGNDFSGLDLTDWIETSVAPSLGGWSIDLSASSRRSLAEVSDQTGESSEEQAAARADSREETRSVLESEVPDEPAQIELPLEGVSVPGYEILEELGRGGMGVVYKARHLGLNRLVALKMILAGGHAGASALTRFRMEAEAIAQLQHPHIVQIYEIGERNNLPYFSLEFVDGGSLDQHIKKTPLTLQAAAELVEILSRTMDVAHQLGIVHRDLKPANILLSLTEDRSSRIDDRKSSDTVRSAIQYGRTLNLYPKITDFGLAKRVNDESDSTQTQAGTVLGTPSFMAPEQAAGKNQQIGPAVDIYALGAILYDLIVGRPPFKAAKPIDTVRQVIEQEPVPPRQLEPRVPRDLENICLKCLRKEPGKRYATALDLADDLRRFLTGQPILARPTPAWERAWKWGRRRPAVVALLGVSAAAVIAMICFFAWHNISLREDVAQAREEERLAREREQVAYQREHEALEKERIGRLKAEGQALLREAEVAAAVRDWNKARGHLTRVLGTVGAEPRLELLKAPAQELLKQVERALAVEAEQKDSRARLQQFAALRDEAQFLATAYTGLDLPANLEAARATVRQALAVYGVTPAEKTPGTPPTLDAHLDETQKQEILSDCYQLLLILAEVEGRSASELKAAAQKQRLQEALRYLEQALQFGPPSRAYHLRRARFLSRLGNETAASAASTAADQCPLQQLGDYLLVADESFRRGQFEQAIKDFDQVLQRKPGHFWAQYLSALCLLREHRPAEARAHLSACLGQRPDFPWLYLLRGYAQTELQAFGGADADFQKASQMTLDDSARYVLLVNRGVLRIRQNRLDDAIVDLKAAIELKPNGYQAPVNLALAYRQQKKLDLAIEQLNLAIELQPVLAQLYRLRGRLRLERNEYVLALKNFELAIQYENPSSPFLTEDHIERGRLLLRDRKYEEALKSFEAALRRQPDHSAGQRLRAEALFQMRRFAEVIEAFDQYLKNGKPLESVYRGRGLARAELGKHPGAIEDFTKALELRPTSTVYAYRAWAHLVCDAPKLALRDFQLAIDLDEKNADAYTGRGLILASEGRHRDAALDAETALRHGPLTPRLIYNAARIHALCGVENETRALDLIRQAVDSLPSNQRAAFWTTYVQKDNAMQVLRRNPRFLQMEAEFTPGQ